MEVQPTERNRLIHKYVIIDYINHRGERSNRKILPMNFGYGSTEWHTENQWLLEALDIDKGEIRTFAVKDIHSWKPYSEEAQAEKADG